MSLKLKLRSMSSRIIERLSSVAPKKPYAVIYGFPVTEGNVTALIHELSNSYRGKVFWLDGDSHISAEIAASGFPLRILKRYSVAAVYRYLTAEVVFFTHGLYGDPVPNRRSSLVNLWHGDGIKIKPLAARNMRSMVPASFVVGGTRLLGLRKTVDFRMPESSLLLSGNPRIDLFRVPTGSDGLRCLGINPAHPFVLWMPTFRKTRSVGAMAAWSDVVGIPKQGLEGAAKDLAAKLSRNGIQLVVKPHPLDAESRSIEGSLCISDDSIRQAGTSLYSLLAASSGLVTDYSSVWTDYLCLDRPIGFVVTDRREYESGRGIYPSDILDWLPGEDLTDPRGLDVFIADVQDSGVFGSERRTLVADRLGLVKTDNASLKLLRLLDERNVFRRSGGLRS